MQQPQPVKPRRKPSYLLNVLGMKCPRCRQGKIFQHSLSLGLKKNLAMPKACPVCGQPTEIEVGFYYGTGYVSYALTVAFSVFTFLLWVVFIGISVEDNSVFIWLGVNAVLLIMLQPWIMRLSRSIWLSWFVKYDPEWEQHEITGLERVIEEQMEGRQDIGKKTLE